MNEPLAAIKGVVDEEEQSAVVAGTTETSAPVSTRKWVPEMALRRESARGEGEEVR